MHKKIARLIIGRAIQKFDISEGRKVLIKGLKTLRKRRVSATYLITPGGFLGFKLPAIKNLHSGWDTNQTHVNHCASAAGAAIRSLMSKEVIELAKNTVSYITICIDSRNGVKSDHIELVYVYDVKKRKVSKFTGKSYPTLEQENRLLRISDAESHFFKHGKDRILVLGCHDLNIFSARVKSKISKGTKRHETVTHFKRATKKFSPNLILHHPHLTDSSRIWQIGWAGIRDIFGNDIKFASALRYKGRGNRTADKEKIRSSTVSSSLISEDIIIS
jgi:hypothetical protein